MTRTERFQLAAQFPQVAAVLDAAEALAARSDEHQSEILKQTSTRCVTANRRIAQAYEAESCAVADVTEAVRRLQSR